MKKVVLIALTVIAAGVATSKADVGFSIQIGGGHRGHHQPPVHHVPAPVVVEHHDVIEVPVYEAHHAPVYGHGHHESHHYDHYRSHYVPRHHDSHHDTHHDAHYVTRSHGSHGYGRHH